jgi:hypothetical protein
MDAPTRSNSFFCIWNKDTGGKSLAWFFVILYNSDWCCPEFSAIHNETRGLFPFLSDQPYRHGPNAALSAHLVTWSAIYMTTLPRRWRSGQELEHHVLPCKIEVFQVVKNQNAIERSSP